MLSATKLRQNIYQVLDHVATTGEVIEINRKGQVFEIKLQEPVSKLEKLTKRPDVIVGDDNLDDIDWSNEWQGYKDL